MYFSRSPKVTKFLILLNFSIHFFVLFYGFYVKKDPLWLQDFYYRFGLVPVEFWNGAFWQPFTSLFLHSFYGFSLHLLVNMMALWSLGAAMEMTIGSVAFAWLYTVSGLFGSLMVVLFQSDTVVPTIGASGAVMGLLASLSLFYPNSMLMVFFIPMKARTAALIFGLGSLLLAFFDNTTNLSHWGHFGGFLGGFLYTKLALQLRFGSNQLYTRKSYWEQVEDEIRERLDNIEDMRRYPYRGEYPFLEKEILEDNGTKLERTPPRTRKLYFDPETGKFYIIEN